MEGVPHKNRAVTLRRANSESRKKEDKHEGGVKGRFFVGESDVCRGSAEMLNLPCPLRRLLTHEKVRLGCLQGPYNAPGLPASLPPPERFCHGDKDSIPQPENPFLLV